MLRFLTERRRRKLLATPFPADWLAILDANVAHYARLSPAEQAILRDRLRILESEKSWEGCNGLAVTPEIRVTIAAQAALLLLGDAHDYFSRVPAVLVYPTAFLIPDDDLGDRDVTGVTAERDPVVLSWDHVLTEGRDPDCGYNVVVHEFAHQFDFLDGERNGTPPLADAAESGRWREVMQAAFDRHLADLDTPDGSLFSEDADDETEFFADVCEVFFCRPADLHADFPAVYGLFAGYFGAEPVKWFT